MRHRVIHLINPKTHSLTDTPSLPEAGALLAPRGVDRRSSRHSSRSL